LSHRESATDNSVVAQRGHGPGNEDDGRVARGEEVLGVSYGAQEQILPRWGDDSQEAHL
jgi:hypothetical protein